MNLSNLEYYREVSINGVIVDSANLTGDVVISNDQSKTTEATFGMYMTEDFVPLVQNPKKTAISMMNQQVVIKGGYKRDPNGIRTLFKGKVVRCGALFPDDGQPILNFECLGLSVKASIVSRNQNYPVVGRDTTPVSDKGIVARKRMTGDVRQWAVVKTGQTLNLKTIIKNIITEYGIPVIDDESHQSIMVPSVEYDGKNKMIAQKNESDWKFLQRLARMYNCVMYIDNDTDIFYFVERTLIRNQETLNKQGQPVTKTLSFHYHRFYSKKPFNLANFEKMDPAREDANLVMQGISYDFDATSVQGGLVSNYTTPDGKPAISVVRQEDDGKITQENLVLRDEMLNSPEARAFIKKYAMGEVTWEETKQFYRVEPVKQVEQALVRENPPVYGRPNLDFSVLGCAWITPMKKYQVHNMGFGRQPNGTDSFPLLCTTVEHVMGEIWTTKVGMMVF